MLFRALGRFIDSLGGEYLTGEDVGTTLQDMDHMRVETRNVITLPESAGGAGPIGPATAFGVLQAMRACVEQQSGSPSLRGKRVVVQGLGAVGVPMVEFLVGEGATVLVSDIDPAKVECDGQGPRGNRDRRGRRHRPPTSTCTARARSVRRSTTSRSQC